MKAYGIVKSMKRDIGSKIVLMDGDCTKPLLGLSLENQNILKNEVTIVINGAANVRLDEPLRVAYEANVNSALEMVVLAKQMRLLKV